jgi:hypothetical protein
MPEALPEALVATEDFSLIALFLRADLIVQAVMAILALASVWSLAVAIDKFFSISGAKCSRRARYLRPARACMCTAHIVRVVCSSCGSGRHGPGVNVSSTRRAL